MESMGNNSRKPNILFIYPDQHRGDWTEFNSALPIHTPNIKSLGTNGIHFQNAMTPSPLCVPARACIASGREYDNCDIINNKQNLSLEQTTFYSLLRDEANYHVMACGKFDFRKPEKSFGRDGQQVVDGESYLPIWGFSEGIDNAGKNDGVNAYRKGKTGPYINYLEEKGLAKVHDRDFKLRSYHTRRPTPLDDEDYGDNWIGRQALRLIRGAPKDKSWFLQVNFNGPHPPMDVTERMRERWKGVKFPNPTKCYRYLNFINQGIRQNYAAMIENIDRWVGIFVDELKDTGDLENTLIVYASDHGEMLCDHNRTGKRFPYHASQNVPAVIYGPHVKKRGSVVGPIETIDLVGTFLDYAGLEIPEYMDCMSLKPYLSGNGSLPREYARSGFMGWRSVFDGRFKLIVGFEMDNFWRRLRGKKYQGKERQKEVRKEHIVLFDLKNDPNEKNDVSGKFPEKVRELRKKVRPVPR